MGRGGARRRATVGGRGRRRRPGIDTDRTLPRLARRLPGAARRRLRRRSAANGDREAGAPRHPRPLLGRSGEEDLMDVLVVERAGGVVTATMNRPHVRNALDAELFEALRALFVEVGSRDDDRVLVLTGEGGAFSSGGDLSPAQPSGADPGPVLRRFG